MATRQQLFSPVNAFIQGRQARQQEDYGESRNALAQMEVEQAPRDIANRNALAERQQKQFTDQDRQANTEWMAGASEQVLALPADQQPQAAAAMFEEGKRRGIVQPGAQMPPFDPQKLQQFVADAKVRLGQRHAPKMETIGSTEDIAAGIVQRDPVTGVLKQVVAPQRPDNFATGQANADRRAQEQRTHAERMAEQQRGFTAEQNQLNRDAKLKPATPSPEAAAQKLDSAMNTLSAIKDVKDKIGLMTAGPGGQLMRAFAGTDASDMEANIDTIKANIGFDRLQMMRDASKTGGALGGIAVQELNLLQSTIASLNPKQSPDQLRRNLEKVEAQYTKSVEAYSRALGAGQPAPQQSQAPQQAIEYLKANPQFKGAFRQKYGYLPSDL